MTDQTVRELKAALFFASALDLDLERCLREWEGWGYNNRVEHQTPDRIEIFKGGAYVILRSEAGAPELPWEDLEQQAELLKGVSDVFDHAAALAAAERCTHRLLVTVRVLEENPKIILHELFITLSGLIAATGAAAVWLEHSQALFTAAEFVTEVDWLRLDNDGVAPRSPQGLYLSVQLRLPLDRCDCPVGFTRGLRHFGWPEFEVEDHAAPPPVAVIYRTLVNGALHQLGTNGGLGPDEFVLTSTGRWRIEPRARSLNFDGEVYPLRHLA